MHKTSALNNELTPVKEKLKKAYYVA